MLPQACVRFDNILRHQYDLPTFKAENWKVPILAVIILNTINRELSYHANTAYDDRCLQKHSG